VGFFGSAAGSSAVHDVEILRRRNLDRRLFLFDWVPVGWMIYSVIYLIFMKLYSCCFGESKNILCWRFLLVAQVFGGVVWD
jgi:hypothetical protein